MSLSNKNTTANHHHFGPETQFNLSPGEGRGHKPAGTPAREGKSYIGKVVPVKPFEGGLKAVSSLPVVNQTVESYVRVQEPTFPINIVAEKVGHKVKRIFTVEESVPEIKGRKVVKCTDEGVDVVIPADKKDLIPAICWAIRAPLFWSSVIHCVAGLPLPKDRLLALKEKGKGSALSPLSILKERESQPEFVPCGGLPLQMLKRKLIEFWPATAPAYPESQKRFSIREISLLQSAVNKDMFHFMVANPVLWLPIRESQMEDLLLEFSTVGSIVHGLAASHNRLNENYAANNDEESAEMVLLPKEALMDVQLAERERSLSESSDDCLSEEENLVEPGNPAGGIALDFHDDRKELFHENHLGRGNHDDGEAEQFEVSTVLHDAEQEEKVSKSRHHNHAALPRDGGTNSFVQKSGKSRDSNVRALRFYKAEVAELADDENSDHSVSRRVVLSRGRKPKNDRESVKFNSRYDNGYRTRHPPEVEVHHQRRRTPEKEKLPERNSHSRGDALPEKAHVPKPTTFLPPDGEPTKDSRFNWSSCWNKVQSLVRKEPKAVMQPTKLVSYKQKEEPEVVSQTKLTWFSRFRTETGSQDGLCKKESGRAAMIDETQSNQMLIDAYEPSSSTVRGSPADCPTIRETATRFTLSGRGECEKHSSPEEKKGSRNAFFDDDEDDNALYEEKKGSTDPRFVKWCLQAGRDPTGGASREDPNMGPLGKLKAYVSNVKKQKEETRKEECLRKLSEDELASREAVIRANERRKIYAPPDTQKDKEDWVPNHEFRLNQLTNHFEMLRRDVKEPKAYCGHKKKRARFAWRMVEYGPAPKEWPDQMPAKDAE